MKKIILLSTVLSASFLFSGCVSPVKTAGDMLQKRDWEAAVRVCDRALEDGKDTPDANLYFLRAQALWRLNRIAEADADLDKALASGLNNGQCHILRAQIRMFECKYKQAADESLLAMNAMPDSDLPKKMYQSAKARENQVKGALAGIQASLAREKDPVKRDLLTLAFAKLTYFSTENGPADAVRFLSASDRKDTPAVSDVLAWILLNSWDPAQRDYKKALALAEKNIKAVPDDPLFLETLALAQTANGKYDDARKSLDASWKKAGHRVHNTELLPVLKKDYEEKARQIEAKKYQPARRGAVRPTWVILK